MDKEIVKEYSWVKYIRKRTLKDNKNFLPIITGPTGSGKSWAALSIGELVDDEFDITRVVFRGRELMDLINSGKLKAGSVIVWDEAGIDLSSRNWQSLTNKMLNFVLQTFRHMNFVLIFTVPYHDFLDVASRKLFHAEFETVSINKVKQTCRIKPKLLQYNPDLKKWYKKYLKVIKKGTGRTTLKKWNLPKPSQQLIDDYEVKKTKFTASLNREIELKLEKEKKKEEEAPKLEENFTRALTPLQAKVLHIWKQGIFVQKEIAGMIGSSGGTISETIASMRKKGCRVEDYRDNDVKILRNPRFSPRLPELTPTTT